VRLQRHASAAWTVSSSTWTLPRSSTTDTTAPTVPKAPATLYEAVSGQQIPDTGREGVQGLWFSSAWHPTQPQRRADGVLHRGCVVQGMPVRLSPCDGRV
jgi:hypothetical protein